MKQMTIVRSKWARRTQDRNFPNGQSGLLNHTGAMCCLGFNCKLNGAADADMLNTGMPDARFICDLDYQARARAVVLNDRQDHNTQSDAEQEAAIAALFLEANVEVTFVD